MPLLGWVRGGSLRSRDLEDGEDPAMPMQSGRKSVPGRGQDGQEPGGAKERGNLRNCEKPIVCITEGLAKEESGDGSGHQMVQALATQGMESDITGNH